jgi:Acyclic terpene utilisation family protein AtuA
LKTIRIGSGAGYAADRWEPALELIETSALDYIVFECLAERTIALGQLERQRDPTRGYNPYLEDRWRALLGPALRRGVRIVTNMGAANPLAAGKRTRELAAELGLTSFKVAVVTGDDVLEQVRAHPELAMLESGEAVGTLGNRLIAANAYLGAEAVRDALATGADMVITGRVADPSLFVGPMMHAFGWKTDDWPMMGKGTALGHLLECAGQVTGGYFADPGVKDVDGLDRLGFPFAEIAADGSAFISKSEDSGGLVSPATLTEQILYECGDPSAYITPDCVADFSGMRFTQRSKDVVDVAGAWGHPRTDTLKVTCCYEAGFIGEAHVGYAGQNARERAELAASIVRSRIAQRGLDLEDLRIDLIGLNSLHGAGSPSGGKPYEVRLRVAARTQKRRHAEYVAQETQSLLTNGPSGGGGDYMQVRDLVGVRSVLMPRDWITPEVVVL